jgi:hypothetical protein
VHARACRSVDPRRLGPRAAYSRSGEEVAAPFHRLIERYGRLQLIRDLARLLPDFLKKRPCGLIEKSLLCRRHKRHSRGPLDIFLKMHPTGLYQIYSDADNRSRLPSLEGRNDQKASIRRSRGGTGCRSPNQVSDKVAIRARPLFINIKKACVPTRGKIAHDFPDRGDGQGR